MNPSACLGENSCRKGYTGPLCAACSHHEGEKSVPKEPYHCALCQTTFNSFKDWASLIGKALPFIIGIVMLILQIKSAINTADKIEAEPDILLDDGEFRLKRLGGFLWKHVLSYYQLISIFSSFGQLLGSYSMIFKPPFTQVMYFIECYTSLISQDPLQFYLQMLAFSWLLYCIVAFLIMGIFLRNRLKPNFWPGFITACIVILQNLLLSLIHI
eukprot:TRINITY_DN16254_c0_g1_i2.p1 TRINITY_DN16254_c0_g1~~TRINITY_DN16254_c0_g1_i2.p1  ORF type:complete len:214 (-),score=2.66 TRINITY_DN16254_c0_g1_i2:50-691(-)